MSAAAGTALVAALLVAVARLVLPGRPRPARPRAARGGGGARPPLPDAALLLDLVAAVVEAGAPPPAAVDAVARVLREAGSPVAEHLAGLGAAAPGLPAPPGGRGHLDRGAEHAVASLRGPLARCLELAEQTGAPVAVLLRSAADELRRRRRRAAALAAARLGVRVVAPLGLCTLPAFAALAVVPVLISLGRDLLAG
ncbi:type II secretion system F family protein [Quadrisphaera sp. INWT6]|uniref:type II secretion system F family protein n=1 Tax=Quadrisphaera sp. INWT6 TaxID=2596917 RepID=UPI0018924D79|nr:type II secretion system F family protein [Quadrisphaera sp. INWT6]